MTQRKQTVREKIKPDSDKKRRIDRKRDGEIKSEQDRKRSIYIETETVKL